MNSWVDDGKTWAKRGDLKLWDKNPRSISKARFKELCDSITRHGQFRPLVVMQDGTVIGGNMRLRAMEALGIEDIYVSLVDASDPKTAFEIALRDNERFGYYEEAQLVERALELDFTPLELKSYQLDLGKPKPLDLLVSDFAPSNPGSLQAKFGVPPFSVLDTRQGYWQERAQQWGGLMGNVSATREDKLGFSSVINGNYGKNSMATVSELDPVLCELAYNWFSPTPSAKILNPFGGEPVSAFVAAYLGYSYTGVELRQEQVDETLKKCTINPKNVVMVTGDARDTAKLAAGHAPFDLIFSSPPFYDLEVYSDQADDLSNFKSYEDFMAAYRQAFAGAISLLADNRFVVINVTEIRDKAGVYRNFVGDNVRMFTELGLSFYNDVILVNVVGTAAIRASRNMNTRKLTRVHQNVLVFYKGDVKKIKDHFSDLAVEFADDGTQPDR